MTDDEIQAEAEQCYGQFISSKPHRNSYVGGFICGAMWARAELEAELARAREERDHARAAVYTACAQLAWHNDRRGDKQWIARHALDLIRMVSTDEEAGRTATKLDYLAAIAAGGAEARHGD